MEHPENSRVGTATVVTGETFAAEADRGVPFGTKSHVYIRSDATLLAIAAYRAVCLTPIEDELNIKFVQNSGVYGSKKDIGVAASHNEQVPGRHTVFVCSARATRREGES
jgi:hypothetical protein